MVIVYVLIRVQCTRCGFVSCDDGMVFIVCYFFFFQAEDGIRDLVRSRGLGDVYKRQIFFIQARSVMV